MVKSASPSHVTELPAKPAVKSAGPFVKLPSESKLIASGSPELEELLELDKLLELEAMLELEATDELDAMLELEAIEELEATDELETTDEILELASLLELESPGFSAPHAASMQDTAIKGKRLRMVVYLLFDEECYCYVRFLLSAVAVP